MNETDATAIFAPLWRRKWLILAVAILVAGGSYLYYRNRTKLFQSSTLIYLGGAAEESVSAEKGGSRSTSVNAANQVAVINEIVIPQVRRGLRLAEDPAASGTVKAKSGEKSEFITITAESHTAKGTARLANTVAAAYVKRQNAGRRRGINAAIEIARRQLRRIEATSAAAPATKSSGKSAGSSTSNVLQEATLSSRINALESNLSVVGAQQVSPARPAAAQLLSPKPRKNAIFGFVIGLALACIVAYALGRLDRRLRTLAGIEGVFGAQILTALPTVRRPLVFRDGAPSPSNNLLEPLHRLHATLKLRSASIPAASAGGNGLAAAAGRTPRVILVTSADPGDGKSTVTANLALVQRSAGERVAVIDANLRRPAQARLLAVDGAPGLAEVLMGSVDVEDAMRTVGTEAFGGSPVDRRGGVATAVGSLTRGSISVLASGGGGANPHALLASEPMSRLLGTLSQEFDSVLIDGPSPLEVSDVLPVLSLVDGVLAVARVGHTREPSAQRLVQLLRDEARAPLLGVVANCVAPKDIQRYGLSARNGAGWTHALLRR